MTAGRRFATSHPIPTPATTPCARCNAANAPANRFCEACGAPLGATCARCGASLAPTAGFCGSCGAPRTEPPPGAPTAYTPRHLAEKILTTRGALAGERKQVTVLFADVKGSMELAAQVDAEALHRILDGFFTILAEGVHRFEGTVNQFTGDGIMALFGAPIAHEDHARRACHTALYLREELRRYADGLRRSQGVSFSVRMGLNSGEVVVGAIGDDLRMDYTAQGHTVGLAQRMEQLAEPGTAYLTEHTAALVSGFFRLEDLGAFTVKGVREPLPVYRLEDVGPLRTRFDASRRRGFSRFVGREAEMAALEAALARATDGHGSVVGVVGEPGVGKSRLCHEFVQRCRARGLAVHGAQALAHGKSVPFLVMLELTRDYFGITDHDGDQAAREKIAGKMLLLDRSLEDLLPLLFEFLGVPDPEHPAPRIDPEARQRQLTDVARRMVPARSRRGTVVFLVEDLHWMDSGSEFFLGAQVATVPTTRTLLVVNFRPEYRAPWMTAPHYQEVALAPLGDAAVTELLQDLLGTDPSTAGLATRIRTRTGGNPFFVEEVVQALVEDGHLVGRRGACRLARPVDEVAIPPGVHAVLAARIDRLAERDKEVLQTAAVIGKRFAEPVLRRVVALDAAALAAALRALTEAEFVYEEEARPEPEFAFKHRLTQEVAYYSQLADRRARTHAAVAREIEALYRDRLDERAALLAHHWEGAGDLLAAARWARRAARWVRGSNLAEARRHWQDVRVRLASVPPSAERTALLLESCTQLLELGWRLGMPLEDAATLFAEGEGLAVESGDRRGRAMLVSAHAALRSHVGSADDFVDSIRQAVALAEETDDAALRLATRTRLVIALASAGRLREALPRAEAVLADPPSELRLGTAILGYSPYLRVRKERATLLLEAARIDEGVQELERAAQLAHEEDDLEVLGFTHAEYVTLARLRGDREAALTHAREVMRIAERLGSPFFRAHACMAFGQAHILGTQWADARGALDEALAIARAGQAGVETEALALAWLAAVHLGLGNAPEAGAAATEALAAAARRRTRTAECIAHIGYARVLLRLGWAGESDGVERALARALALVEETGAYANEPFIRVQRARLALLVGDRTTHQRELRAAHDQFAAMGATARVQKLAAELA